MAKVGRPTKYSSDIIKKTEEYLLNYQENGDRIPMICGLALYLGLNKDTIYDWVKHDDKKEFSDLVGDIMQTQEKMLVNEGLAGNFNSTITKLALGKHGFHDKQDHEHTGVDGGPISTTTTFVGVERKN